MKVCMLLHKSIEHDSRVQREARALHDAGHDVVVVQLARTGADASAHAGGYRVHSWRPAWLERVPRPVRLLAFAVVALRRALRLRPDVVHAHDFPMLPVALLAARIGRSRTVYDSHEYVRGLARRAPTTRRIIAIIESVLARRAEAVIVVSGSIAERLHVECRLPRVPTVVRNLPARITDEPAEALDLRQSCGIGTRPLVLYQGAAALGRGCETLVRALGQTDEAHLVFLGDHAPGYEPLLRRLADEAGIAERVHFVPSVPVDALLAHTRQADVGACLIHPTTENHRLTLPNKLFEYVAAEVPVLASAGTDTGRFVADWGVGWVVDPESPDEVARALRAAVDAGRNGPLRSRLERAARELTWEREQTRLLAVYERLGAVTR